MTKLFVSVRGYVDRPVILEVDPLAARVVKVNEFEEYYSEKIPISKRGFCGLQLHGGFLYAASWNKVFVIDPSTMKIVHVVSDKRFSDLHDLSIDSEGKVWVVSTNVDGIFVIDGDTVTPVWHTWSHEKGQMKLSTSFDYGGITKEESHFHRLHLNSVLVVGNNIFTTFLGSRPKQRARPLRLVNRVFRRNTFFMKGGIFVVDRVTRKIIKKIESEGLHDTVLGHNGKVLVTEYYGNAIGMIDVKTLSYQRLQLELPPYRESGYLTRGVLEGNEHYWVGHTTHRDWMARGNEAKLRSYTKDGRWTGIEIPLPGYTGAYSIVKG